MTSGVIVPIRVPELGPSLGKLIIGTDRRLEAFPLDGFRAQLANRVMTMVGDARGYAATDNRTAAVVSLGRDAWLGAWEDTVTALSAHFVDYISVHLDAEMRAVRMPVRQRRARSMGDGDRRGIAARLGTAGAGLVPALERVEAAGAAVEAGSGQVRQALEDWQGAQRAVARRLEEAWLALEEQVGRELERWYEVADDIARWRKPWWPVAAVGVPAMAVAVWAGLMWGGVLAVPIWLADLWAAVRALVER